ncbi:leukocyte cell-derived chemotaxin 1-like [Ptychodera flava]|uniref:leukocyte cell-derived chemotaxin 1-like n=1 Tax=Ptychodera flava TaxID=63121 RepID=UPI00396A58C7
MKTLVIIVASLFAGVVLSAPTDSTTKDSQENTYSIKVSDHGVEKEDTIIIDEEKNIEIFQTVDSDDAEVVEDFDAGLEGIIPRNGDSCYVKPLNSGENIPPAELKSRLESSGSENVIQEQGDKDDDLYVLAGGPIKNRAVVGETIAEKCEGRNIYWLTLAEDGHQDQGRVKRSCYLYYCSLRVYLGKGRYYYHCYIVRYLC